MWRVILLIIIAKTPQRQGPISGGNNLIRSAGLRFIFVLVIYVILIWFRKKSTGSHNIWWLLVRV